MWDLAEFTHLSCKWSNVTKVVLQFRLSLGNGEFGSYLGYPLRCTGGLVLGLWSHFDRFPILRCERVISWWFQSIFEDLGCVDDKWRFQQSRDEFGNVFQQDFVGFGQDIRFWHVGVKVWLFGVVTIMFLIFGCRGWLVSYGACLKCQLEYVWCVGLLAEAEEWTWLCWRPNDEGV